VIIAAASIAMLVFLGSFNRFESSATAFVLCLLASLLASHWLRSSHAIARLVAACICCVAIPLAVGLLACTIYNVRLGQCDEVLCYGYFITEIDRSQLAMDGYLRRLGSSGWRGGAKDWGPAVFFFATIIAVGILHSLTLRSFPKMVETS
jgi:hypothetical protein